MATEKSRFQIPQQEYLLIAVYIRFPINTLINDGHCILDIDKDCVVLALPY